MANSFTFLYPYIDKAIQEIDFEKTACLTQFEKDLEPAAGLTGRIPRPAPMTASAFSASMIADSGNSGTISGINFSVTEDYESTFRMLDTEGLGLGGRGTEVLARQIQECVRAVLNAIASGFYASGVVGSSTYSPGIPNICGTAGTTPFATPWADMTNVNIALARNLCPDDNRVGIVDLAAWANIINATGLWHVGEAGNSDTLRNAKPGGNLFGFNVVYDTKVPTFAGNQDSGFDATDGGWRITGVTGNTGDVVFTGVCSGNSGGVDLAMGDIVWFSGLGGAASTGYGESYVITTAPTPTSGDSGNIYLWPGLRSYAASGAGIVTLSGTRRQNIFGHRSAFRLVMRDPRAGWHNTPRLGESFLYVDPRTGVPLLITLYPGRGMMTVGVRALWTWVPIKPEWACILAG
jgi:hypothetical protein